MPSKISFEMSSPEPKKHSVKYTYVADTLPGAPDKFAPSFYIPNIIGITDAKRLRVTIEVVE
jgi:hypothetical protein